MVECVQLCVTVTVLYMVGILFACLGKYLFSRDRSLNSRHESMDKIMLSDTDRSIVITININS